MTGSLNLSVSEPHHLPTKSFFSLFTTSEDAFPVLTNVPSPAQTTTMMRLPLKPPSLSLPQRHAPGMRAGFSAALRRRAFASRPTPPRPAPFPTVETCPSPTCGCAPMPAFPDGLEIDRAAPMNGVVAAYAEQVLVCTGRDDWASRIEDDEGGDNFAADMKRAFGRGGRYTDVSFSVFLSFFPFFVSPHRLVLAG